MNNVFFTSDEHYDHKNILEFQNRPFKDVTEMRELLIENHNKVVKRGDRVYHLGDMFWRTLSLQDCIAIRQRLNGVHYYIYGNHEEVFRHKILQQHFVWCKDVFNLHIPGLKPNIWLSHYPHEDWNGSHKGAYHLFGHVHGGKLNPAGLKMDVGVDANDYTPVSLETVTERLGAKAALILTNYWSCDNVECKHKFNAVDDTPKICAKCSGTMKLMTKLKD